MGGEIVTKNEEDNEVYKLIEVLERRIRIIRSARIEASKRYKEDDNFYRFVTIFYSIIVTVMSIRFAFGLNTLDDNGDKNLSILLLVTSVFVTLFTMYVSIKNSGEKVGRFQSNYMEITRLKADIQLSIANYKTLKEPDKDNMNKDYISYAKRYASMLTQSENHDDIDYWRAVKREDNDEDKIKIAKKKISVYRMWKYFKRTLALCSVPLLITLIFIMEFVLNRFW